MIKLYKFGPIGDICDPSPFCVKVEAYLRMTNQPYETVSGAQYLRKAPKRKLPYIEDNGKIIADSSFILNYLKNFGDQPTSLDAVGYGMLVQMIRLPVFTAPVFDKAKSYQNLISFTERFHNAYFGTG